MVRTLALPLPLETPLTQVHLQAFLADPGGGPGACSASNGLKITID